MKQISIEKVNFFLNFYFQTQGFLAVFAHFPLKFFATFFNQWQNLDDFDTSLEYNVKIRATILSLLIMQVKAQVMIFY